MLVQEEVVICYKDQTFCHEWKKCVHGDTCFRSLKPEIFVEADKIGLPIMSFACVPDCFEAKKDETWKTS